MVTGTTERWRDVRREILNKWQGVRICDDPSPLYMNIPTQFCNLANVTPEEQENMMFTELKLFLLGNQTENIRIRGIEDNIPTEIEVNISFDPFLRSEIERFHDNLIAIATIKLCCYAITHNAVTFSPIGAQVANTIDKKVTGFVLNVCDKLDAHPDAPQLLNNLFREVHSIYESLGFYSEIVKTIYTEQLIGGQVLTLLDAKRRHVFSGNAIQDLEDVFQAGWKIFAGYIGRLVCKFEADNMNYEFVLWSTQEMDENQRKRIFHSQSSTRNRSEKAAKFVIVEALCPKFFTKYLDILVRCAEFGEASNADEMKRNWKKMDRKGEQNRESVQNVMEDVRKVQWANLDVTTIIRMLVQFSRKESACLLREITSATNVDQAIRDIHELLLRGSCAHEVMAQCIKNDILQKPVDEIGSVRMKKLTNDILGAAAEKHHPFWKYFSFKIEKQNVFEMLGQRMQRHGSMNSERVNTIPTLFECITLSMDCPVEIDPIISKNSVFTLIPIFRIWLQLHVASWRLANARDALRGMMPSRSGSELTMKKHLMNALDWKIADFKQKWSAYVNVAVASYYERISKAISLDEYIECQNIFSRDITKMMGITELSQLEIIKDILNIVWSHDNDSGNLGELIADFEELQSKVGISEGVVA